MKTLTMDTRPENPAPCCINCATWVCHECWDWHRTGANRHTHQYCIKCGGIVGMFTAVRHTKPHWPNQRVPFRIPETLPTTAKETDRLRFMGPPILY